MSQVKSRMVSLESVMRTAEFMRGFRDKMEGKPFDYDGCKKPWDYERGRQFACVFSGAVKDGRKIRWDAKCAMNDAVYDRLVI
jgi:hypothetical protein